MSDPPLRWLDKHEWLMVLKNKQTMIVSSIKTLPISIAGMLSMTKLMKIQTLIDVEKNQNAHQRKKIRDTRRPVIQIRHMQQSTSKRGYQKAMRPRTRKKSLVMVATMAKQNNNVLLAMGTTPLLMANVTTPNERMSNRMRSRDDIQVQKMEQGISISLR